MNLANLSIEAGREAHRRERLDYIEHGIKHWKKMARRFQHYLDCYVDIFLTDEYVLRRLKECTEFLQHLQSELDPWDGPRVDQMRADLQKEIEKGMKRLHYISPVLDAINQYRFQIPYSS